MTALKKAVEEVSGFIFFLPAGRNHKKEEGMRKEQLVELVTAGKELIEML